MGWGVAEDAGGFLFGEFVFVLLIAVGGGGGGGGATVGDCVGWVGEDEVFDEGTNHYYDAELADQEALRKLQLFSRDMLILFYQVDDYDYR